MFLKPSTTRDDLLGYLGDSCVTEVYGLGGMSSIAGPAYARFTARRSPTPKTAQRKLVPSLWESTPLLQSHGTITAASR